MEQIVAYIKDPAWWFSAFFIAIIASVVAGFAKDRIERGLGYLSNRAREWQQRKSEEREKVIRALAQNEGFLIITMVRATGLSLMALGVFTLFLLSPMWSEITQSWCAAFPSIPCMLGERSVSLLASIAYGLLAVVFGYTSSSRIRVTMLGYRAYREQRSLPRGL